MRIYRSIAELPPSTELPRSVAAIGNFDGVHCGHREIIGRVRDRGRVLGAPAIAVTFDPHPLALLRPERAPKLITPIPERLRLLEQTGMDATLVLPFTREFSMQTPREFAEGILCRALRVWEVHEGDTFRFGHDAAAGIVELRELGTAHSRFVASRSRAARSGGGLRRVSWASHAPCWGGRSLSCLCRCVGAGWGQSWKRRRSIWHPIAICCRRTAFTSRESGSAMVWRLRCSTL
jgi:FAD synthase